MQNKQMCGYKELWRTNTRPSHMIYMKAKDTLLAKHQRKQYLHTLDELELCVTCRVWVSTPDATQRRTCKRFPSPVPVRFLTHFLTCPWKTTSPLPLAKLARVAIVPLIA
jgi:hypothetical protein